MKKFFTFIAVAVLAFAAQANVLTVCDSEDTNTNVPIYGLYVDVNGTLGQMIYPADMIADLAGGEITQVKFFTPGINFTGVKLQLSLKSVDQVNFDDYVAVPDMEAVAVCNPAEDDTELVFELAEPFTYENGNLAVEVKVIETAGDWATTQFYGEFMTYNASYYQYQSSWSSTPSRWNSIFLPKAEFTFNDGGVTPPTPPTPEELTAAPTFRGYTEDGIHAYFVEIIPTEPSTIYYRVIYPDGTETDWAEYEDILSFTGDGKYRVEAYAVAPDKLPSYEIAYEFIVAPISGIGEVVDGKTVAGVRYFNMAGQEMQQAEGLTIVVTTYTDGTTSSVKVIK